MNNATPLLATLSANELIRGFTAAIDHSSASPHLVPLLAQEAVGRLQDAAEEGSLKALDRSIGVSGGAAFLWDDVLSVGDAYELLSSALDLMPPDKAAHALITLALFWRRLRGVRIFLNEDEFQVLRAVKRGATTVSSVVTRTNLTTEAASDVVERLKRLPYKEGIFLLEEDDGQLRTQF
jgi:hypothetical protein